MTNKQIVELAAVKIFISKSKLNDSIDNFKFPQENDNIDVVYVPKNLNFQVVSVDGGPFKLYNHKRYEFGVMANNLIKVYVEDPIKHKYDKYRGYAVSDVVLLIHVVRKPFDDLFNAEIERNKNKLMDLFLKSGFSSIYLVFDFKKEIIKLF